MVRESKMKNESLETIQAEHDSIFEDMAEWANYVLIRETGLNTFGEVAVLTASMRAEIRRIERRKNDFNELVGWYSDLYIREVDFEENAREVQAACLSFYISQGGKV